MKKTIITILTLAAVSVLGQQVWVCSTNDMHNALRIDAGNSTPGHTVYWNNISGTQVSNLMDGNNVIKTVTVKQIYYTVKTTNSFILVK